MTSPENLVTRALKLERQESFLKLQEAIKTQPMNASRRKEFLGRIMAATARGAITPKEARKLTKVIDGESSLSNEDRP